MSRVAATSPRRTSHSLVRPMGSLIRRIRTPRIPWGSGRRGRRGHQAGVCGHRVSLPEGLSHHKSIVRDFADRRPGGREILMANFLLPLIRYDDRPHELRNTRTGRSIAHSVIPAFDSDARRKGLLGRDSFEQGSAIVIAPSNAIHTFFMQFSIDAVFVRRDGVVVKVCRSIPPWRMAAAL